MVHKDDNDIQSEDFNELTSEEIEELKTKCEEFENKYKRALADYTNLQRRSEEEKEKFMQYANEDLMKGFLEVLDDLEESQKHIEDEGIDKVIEKFKKLLADQGVEEIKAEGQEFDPTIHEAIESTEGKEGKIVKVHRKGYKFNEKPLRAALVAVGNGK